MPTKDSKKSTLDVQKNKAVKNYKNGKYRNVTETELSNNGVKCAEAKYNFEVTSKIFAPFFASL